MPALTTPVEWSGSVAGCNAGSASASTQAATLSAVNYFRGLAHLDPVTLDPALTSADQSAALMMHANYSLSQFPPSSWTCYTAAGAAAAGRSNLALGISGPGGATPSRGRPFRCAAPRGPCCR